MSAIPGSTPPTLVGRRLGEFELREKIGQGGFGTIFLAEQVGLRRQAVVKILHASLAHDASSHLRFLREAHIASSLDHPYAAHIYAFGSEPDGVRWIAMELVRGTPLSERLKAGPMPLEELVPFLERLCEVVQTAHDHGIVHRDIKPANVMIIRRAGALLPKLLDLGVAMDRGRTVASPSADARPAPMGEPSSGVVGRGASGAGAARALGSLETDVPGMLTSEGELLGSPRYMAPEQWTNAELADSGCDIYALGVLAYEALTGRPPFVGTVQELAEQHFLTALPPLPEALPRALHEVLARAMAKEPPDRPASALVLAREIRRASGVATDSFELPRLARDVVELAVRAYPQPIAEAVAELDGARSEYQARDASDRLARTIVRWLAVLAMLTWQSHRGARPISALQRELASALRKRRLNDEEWLDVLRAFAAPFAALGEGHPLPEIVRAVHEPSPVWELLTALLRSPGGLERASLAMAPSATGGLAQLLSNATNALRALSFLGQYPLAVVGVDGTAELWMGARRKHREYRPVAPSPSVAPGDAVVFGDGDRVVALSPLAVVGSPSANAASELFLLEGRGRRGVLLVAHPETFERTSAGALAWLRNISDISDESTSAGAPLETPYRGLAPLTSADADVFFGREREVDAFLNRLRTEPLLVVVGPSGAGKSSFVRAGVLPCLNETFHAVVFRPGAAPLTAFRAKLAQLGVSVDDMDSSGDAGEVARRLHAALRDRDETLVLCVDQFEECFTLPRDRHERAVFCAWLARVAERTADPVRVVLTLRDDFLAQAQQETAFDERLERSLVLLATPAASALRRIIVEPAQQAGFSFESDALVDEMVHAVEGRAGALALLSFAASKLWEQRSVETRTLGAAAYHAMGGVAGALAQHGEAVLEGMTASQRSLVREACRRLVTSEGTRAATRHDELVAALGGDASARVVIERLVAARLLVVAEGDDGREHIEIIHEALVSAWPRIVEWRREDADGHRVRDQIRTAAQQWEAQRRPRGLLWRDGVVEKYRQWREWNPGGLTASEAAFGEASVAEQIRGRVLRAAVIAILALGAVAISYVAWQQTLARRAAQEATGVAVRAREQAKQSAFHARDATRLAAARLHTEDPTTQLALLRDLEAGEPLPEWAAETRSALHGGVASVVFPWDVSYPYVAFSRDGRNVAVGASDDTVRIWSADGRTERAVLRGHTNIVKTVAFSPDGRHVASGSRDTTVRIWNVDGSGEPVVLRGHGAGIRYVTFSPDGRRVASSSTDKTVRVWNADGVGEPVVLRGHTDVVGDLAFSPDGQRVVSASVDKTVRIWSADGSTEPRVVRNVDASGQLSLSRDGRRIASSANDDTVRVWNLDDAGTPVVLRGHHGGVWGLSFTPDGQRIVTGSEDNTIRIWAADGVGEPTVLRGHPDPILNLSMTADGRRLVAGDSSGGVRVWPLDAPDPLVLSVGYGRERSVAVAVAVSPDGRHVAVASDDLALRVWSADGQGAPRVHRAHEGRVQSISFSADGRRLLSCDAGSARVWDIDGSRAPVALRSTALRACSLAPDGLHVVTLSMDRVTRLWNADGSGQPLVLHTGADDGILIFSPDGRRVFTGTYTGRIAACDADGSGGPHEIFSGGPGVTDMALRPDGRRIAAGFADGTVRVMNTDGSGEPLLFRGHASFVTSVGFSADGERIASGSSDGTIRIWSADGAGEPVVLQGHAGPLLAVRFTPDGRRLISATEDHTVRTWSDLSHLLPNDPRLWQATSYCLPVERLERLLGVEPDIAGSLRARCLERVAAAAPSSRDP